MDNGKKSISDIFNGNKLFSIPYYQRGYAWNDEQLQDFYEDFKTHFSEKSYYYGTILLFNIGSKGITEKYDIVDGQQRLTTLIVFVSSIIRRMDKIQNLSEKGKKLKSKLYEYFIRNDDGLNILTLQNQDNDFFNTYIVGTETGAPINSPSQERLLNAREKLDKYLENSCEEELTEFMNKIYATNLVVYTIDSQIEAAMIFETTNDRGKPLTNLEKTKSYLMYKACVLGNDANQIINSIQQRFINIYNYYSTVQDYIPQEESILQYSFVATSKWGNSQKYKKEYQHYMEIMKDKVDGFIKANDVKGLLNYIDKYTINIMQSYETLKLLFQNQPYEFKDLLALKRMANFYPLLIKSYRLDITDSKENFKKLCRLCEIFCFRVYAIAGKPSYTLSTFWYSLARDFKDDFETLFSQIIGIIQKVESNEKFIENLKNRNFYTEYHTQERNYFFWKYENYLRLNEQPKATPMPHDDLNEICDKKLKLSIEHIVAQRNTDEQSKIITENLKVNVGQPKQFNKEYLNSIGNLTLDPQSANSSKGKNDVEVKNNKYFVRAPYKSQNELLDFMVDNKWTIESINKRKEKLLVFAKKTWCELNRYGKIDDSIQIVKDEDVD